MSDLPPNPFALDSQMSRALSNQSRFEEESQNPYATPITDPATQIESEVEQQRRKYLTHEKRVKSIGLLFWIGAAFTGLIAIAHATIVVVALINGPLAYIPESVMALVISGGVTAVQFMAGRGCRDLKEYGRVLATLLCILGLLIFPLGTLLNAWFLYILQSHKGQVVFSEAYKTVIEQTPHIRYRTSLLMWLILLILLLVICALLFFVALR